MRILSIFFSLSGMTQKWFSEFRCNLMRPNDADRPGCPMEVAIDEMINKTRDIVLSDYLMYSWVLASYR